MSAGVRDARLQLRQAQVWVLLVLCSLCLVGCGPISPNEVLPHRFVDPPELSAAASTQFGQDAVDAYDQVAEFLLSQSYLPALLDPAATEVTVKQLTDGILPALAPAAAASWQQMAAEAVAGDTEARSAVRLLRFHSWDADGSTLPPHGRGALRSQAVTDGKVGVLSPTEDGADRLEVDLVHRADMTLAEDGLPYDLVLTKPLSFTLVRSAQDPSRWLIESLDGELKTRVGQRESDDAYAAVTVTS